MSHFIFKAKKPGGEVYESERDAADRYELYRLIRESGDELVSVEEKSVHKGLKININLGFLKRVKTIDKINFARNLGSMLEAGLALSRGLSVLQKQSHSKALTEVLIAVMADIDRGTTFAEALSHHPKVFSSLLVSMVHAGEQSGTLAQSLKAVALQMESTFALERRIRGALMYPAVILSAMIIIAILMFIFVIPTLLSTFTSLNVQLPFATQVILDISNVVQHQGMFVLLGVTIIVAAYVWWSRKPWERRSFTPFS